MRKIILSIFILSSSASAFAQVKLTSGSSVTLGGVTVTCAGSQQEKPSCWCRPIGNNNEFLMIAQYSNGSVQNLGMVQYKANCDMQLEANPICKQ
jgi:hypothetical protein